MKKRYTKNYLQHISSVSRRFPNSITTCCGLVGRVANKSVTSWQLPRLRESYGETCVV